MSIKFQRLWIKSLWMETVSLELTLSWLCQCNPAGAAGQVPRGQAREGAVPHKHRQIPQGHAIIMTVTIWKRKGSRRERITRNEKNAELLNWGRGGGDEAEETPLSILCNLWIFSFAIYIFRLYIFWTVCCKTRHFLQLKWSLRKRVNKNLHS